MNTSDEHAVMVHAALARYVWLAEALKDVLRAYGRDAVTPREVRERFDALDFQAARYGVRVQAAERYGDGRTPWDPPRLQMWARVTVIERT